MRKIASLVLVCLLSAGCGGGSWKQSQDAYTASNGATLKFDSRFKPEISGSELVVKSGQSPDLKFRFQPVRDASLAEQMCLSFIDQNGLKIEDSRGTDGPHVADVKEMLKEDHDDGPGKKCFAEFMITQLELSRMMGHVVGYRDNGGKVVYFEGEFPMGIGDGTSLMQATDLIDSIP